MDEAGFFQMISKHPDPVRTSVRWRKAHMGDVLCKVCHFVHPGWFPRAVDVEIWSISRARGTAYVSHASAILLRRDLADLLSPYLDEYVLGTCTSEKIGRACDFVTCQMGTLFTLRGVGVVYLRCAECGRVMTQYAEGAEFYWLSADVAGRAIVQAGGGSLYLRADLVRELDFAPWRDLEFIPVLVRDAPDSRDPWPAATLITGE
jgi:hypothetical protein